MLILKTFVMKKISLNSLNRKRLQDLEMSKIIGGAAGTCGCGCPGPSSTCDNSYANYSAGLHSVGVNAYNCHCTSGSLDYTQFAFWGGNYCG